MISTNALIPASPGFFDECKRRYNVRLWRIFGDCFNCMPVAAVVGEKIFCTHGGLSPELDSLRRIIEIQRPTEVQAGIARRRWMSPQGLRDSRTSDQHICLFQSKLFKA